MLNVSFVWVLENAIIAIICWYGRHHDALHGTNSPLVAIFLNFRSFWLSLIVFVSMICLSDAFFKKAMTGIALNTFPNVLLIFNICQCLLMISLIFGKVGLYVTKNGNTFFRTVSILFNRVDLTKLSTCLLWFRMMFTLSPFSTNHLTKSLACFLYSPKVEQTRFTINS